MRVALYSISLSYTSSVCLLSQSTFTVEGSVVLSYIKSRNMEVKMNSDADGDSTPPRLTNLQKFGMLSRFMLPLVVTNMVPDAAEQVKLLE